MQLKEPASGELSRVTISQRPGLQKEWIVTVIIALLVFGLFFFTPGSLLDKLFFINSGICAQRPAHSNFFEGQQLPLEARMIGIFGSFLLTLGFLWFLGRGRVLRLPPRKITIVLILLVGPVALDGLNATLFDLGSFYLYTPQLVFRLISGALGGMAFAVLIQPFFNLVLWRYAYPGSGIKTWRELGWTLGLVSGLVLATLSGWGPLFWPLAFLAVAGVLVMMVMLNIMIFLIVLRRENRVGKVAGLASLGAFTLLFTILEMSLFALLRQGLMV